MANKRHSTTITGDHNITGKYLNNVGNVNIIVPRPSQPLTLESKVAFGALLNSGERHPAPHCHPDTRIAAKKAVKNWIGRRGFRSEKRIMWISGPPGVGKSAILQTVCEELDGGDASHLGDDDEVGDGPIDACYFFGRGMGDREKASFFPATIAYQLVLSRSSCGEEIQAILAKHPSILRESFPSQFRKLVLGPAKGLAESEVPIIIVIDALDECDSARDQVSLLDAVLNATAKANMRFVIASRPEEHIQAFFRQTNVSEYTYHIRLDGNFKASRDIGIFLRDKFAGIRERRPGLYCRLPNGEDWPGSAVIYRLIYDSDGQFIYATLVIAFIDTPYFSPDQQLKTLLAAPPARAFSSLDTLYHRILSCCPPELPAGSEELLDFQKLVMGILRVVACWPEPLSVIGIANVLDKEIDVVRAIIHGPLRSLFKFDSTRLNSIITFCHKSLRDYLLDRLRSQEFYLEDGDTPDKLYTQMLSRQPPSDPSRSYSREVLMGVLTVVVERGNWINVPQIASFLEVAPSIVEGVVFGPAKALFTLDSSQNVRLSILSFKGFLGDANRAGDYFIPRYKPLDARFTQILSRQPPSDPFRSYSREVLMGVLSVVVAQWTWVNMPQIASFLEVAPSIVEGVVFGPAKALFKLNGAQDVKFSISSFKDFLGDVNRAGDHFIPRYKPLDTRFTQILSRQPPSDPFRSYSREVLMGVLSVVVTQGNWVNMPQIASFLEVAPSLVEGVVFGPAKALFKLNGAQDVKFSIPSFEDFLGDANRAGEYFIPPDKSLDARFTQILSRQPPSDPSRSYSREVLVGVLSMVVARGDWINVPQIASFLDVAPSLVEGVVFGPAKALFELGGRQGVGFFIPSFKDFLGDASRAGEYFIPPDKSLDARFTQILSRQPPSDPSRSYSREVLMGVLSVVVAWGNGINVPEIASFLDVAPGLVEGVVFGPAKALFKLGWHDDVEFSFTSFRDFLGDANRAGDYFIPPDKPLDARFTQILSCRPPSDPSRSYSREVLMGVLSMVVAQGNWINMFQIASFLEVAPSLVEGVVFGPAKALFELDGGQDVYFSIPSFKDFLGDANRAGDYFIPRYKPLDAHFTQILSRQPPSDPSQSYSRELLMGVLSMVVAQGNWIKVPQVASILEVAPSLVEGVVFGPAKALFKLGWHENVEFSIPSFKDFLGDATRAGEFFIPRTT